MIRLVPNISVGQLCYIHIMPAGTVCQSICRTFKGDGRLLNLDKKRSQTIFAGVPAANSPGAIRNVDFKQNIQNFWEEVKWNRTQRSRNSSEECPV